MSKRKIFFVILLITIISIISIITLNILKRNNTVEIYKISAIDKRYEASANTTYDVILFWGQSNMVGYCGAYSGELQADTRYNYANSTSVNNFSQLTEIDSRILSSSERMNYVRVWQNSGIAYEYNYLNDSFTEISENTCIMGETLKYNSSTGKLVAGTRSDCSIEASYGTNMIPTFIRAYYELTGRKVIVVFAANGGEKISNFLPSTDSEYGDENNQMIYEAMVEKYKTAVNTVQNLGGTIGKKYWVCCQGEWDVLYNTSKNDYKRIFKKVHNYLKQEIGVTRGAIVETSFAIGYGNYNSNVEIIHAAQEELASENTDIIIGSTYSYDYYIPDESTYNSASFRKPKFLDSQGNKLSYQNALTKATGSVCYPTNNIIHFTSAALSQMGLETAEKLAKTGVIVVFVRNTSSSDTMSTTQTFVSGESGNRFGYDANENPMWAQTGQFGQWDKPGYKLLGWSENRNATSATYETYQQVYDWWINSCSPTITLYAVWVKGVKVTFFRNLNSSDTNSVYQIFGVGQSGNQFGHNNDGSYTWGSSGQFGQWNKSGYTLLGWSEDRNATTATYVPYQVVVDSWIESKSPEITLYGIWRYTVTPTITLVDHDTFNYTASGAAAYYVSTSNSIPTPDYAQSTFELNKWTTAKSTGNLTLSSEKTYYLWIEDSVGSVSPNNASIVVRKVTRTQGTGTTLTTKYDSSSGTAFTITPVYVLNGSKVNVSGSLNTGYQDLVLKNGNSVITAGDIIIVANASFSSSAVDKVPIANNISVTNILKSSSQTATISASDGVGVKAYYWGTTAPTVSNTFTSITTTTSFSATKVINGTGTYYFAVKDTAGNMSDIKSVVIRSYEVYNLLETVLGTTGTYTNKNYSIESNGIYLAKDGTNITLTSVYTIPTGATPGTFKGYSTFYGTNSAAVSTNAPILNSNTIYYMWFNRNTYALTLNKGTGISSVTGTGTYKYGKTVDIDATVDTGYTWNTWERNNGNSPANAGTKATTVTITQETILTARATDKSPIANEISVTNVLKSSTQTATIRGTDGVGINAYYWGTTSPTANSTFTDIAATTSFSATKTINAAGKYYFAVKDTAGNMSDVKFVVIRSYGIYNLLETISGTTGIYSNKNYAIESNETYLAKDGTSITLESVYTVPTGASVETFKGYSTTFGTNEEILIASSPILSSNATYYMWFNRDTYELTLNKEMGISEVTGEGTYKYGKEVNIEATVSTGYIWSMWTTNSGNSPESAEAKSTTVTITQETTLTANTIESMQGFNIMEYTYDENTISRVQPLTKEQAFEENIVYDNNLLIQVVDENNNNLQETDNIKTGDKLKIIDKNTGNTIKEFLIAVLGDVNGDGQADILDLFILNKHRLNKIILTGIYITAGDVNNDNYININDMLQVNKYRLGKINTL